VKLGHEINYEALNYNYPNSPSTLFLWILSSYGRVDDHADVFHSIEFGKKIDVLLGDREMKLLINWLTQMWKLCDTDSDFQMLYDTILKGKY